MSEYSLFISEYRRVSIIIGDNIWNNGYKKFNIEKDILGFPKYLDYKEFSIDTWLSARCMSSICTQISGMIRMAVNKRKRMLFVFNKLKESKIEEKLKTLIIYKPDFSKINPELSSKNVDIQTSNHFDFFVCLKSIGRKKITIPIKKTRLDLKWQQKGKLLGGFSFSDNAVFFRYDVESDENNGTEILGFDQGLKDVITISDGRTTPKKDSYGHTLESITNSLARKKKGSKSFKKAQDHRKNFINWSINKLNFNNIKEVRLEKIYNIGFGKSKSRKMSHWCNTLIRDKIKRKCEEMKVSFVEQSSSYRSQRCSSCGSVRKANRKGKTYSCKHCGNTIDADLNAAKNHEVNLPEIPYSFSNQKYNRGKGFFWKPEGLYSFDGEELRVPLSKNENKFL
jgi:predicted RNA-binding Zn-ribbon protein involved in translation (DUF1610 family)